MYIQPQQGSLSWIFLVPHGCPTGVNNTKPRADLPSTPSSALDILRIIVRDVVQSRISGIGQIRLEGGTESDIAILHRSRDGRTVVKTLQAVCARLNSEICKADLTWVSIHNCWHPKVVGNNLFLCDVQLKITSVVDLGPLQLAIVFHQQS